MEALNIRDVGKEILGNKKIGQELSEELGKYIWLTEADTSQEAPTSKSGSSSREQNADVILDKVKELQEFEKKRMEQF